MADHLVGLLSGPDSRQAGVLPSRLIDRPPEWLPETGGAAWEVWETVGDFLSDHDLPGGAAVHRQAIEAGSPERDRLQVKLALIAFNQGDDESAARMLGEVAPDCPLLEAARAYVGEDASAVEAAVTSERLTESEDSGLALFGVVMLRWAYYRLEDFDSAAAMLKRAVDRCPDMPWLLQYWRGLAAFAQGALAGADTSAGRDLLREAVDRGLEARDLFRAWDGPSHKAVVLTMDALLGLGEFQWAADLGSPRAEGGDATDSEADAPDVYKRLAQALQMLGRYSEIDTVRLDRISPTASEMVRAMQAHDLGDPAAIARMRRAVDKAGDDQTDLRAALWGLAQLGEVHEIAVRQVPATEAALFRGVAALRQDDFNESISVLACHRSASVLHSYYLAEAQHRADAAGEAINTLTTASEHFASEPFSVAILHKAAAEILIEQGKLEEAASMVKSAQALDVTRGLKRDLWTLLASIAERREDWTILERHARDWVRDFSEDDRAAWQVVYALHRQVENRQAWAYLTGRDLMPLDEDTALLYVAVCRGVDASGQAADSMLDLAEEYPHSERLTGEVLSALMIGIAELELTEQQSSRLEGQIPDFKARFPESGVFKQYTGERPEDIKKLMTAGDEETHQHLVRISSLVRYGCRPYGFLRSRMRPIREVPYAELLLSLAAGAITAIPTDASQRDRERRAARQALGSRVAVDTSVAALGIHAELDICRMDAAFSVVLVADELIIDARVTVEAAKRPRSAMLPYDLGLDGYTFMEIDDFQRAEAHTRAERAVQALSGIWTPCVPPDVNSSGAPDEAVETSSGTWRQIHSERLPIREDAAVAPDLFRPWDAAIGVAWQHQCPLWCDDLSLRFLAEALGVRTFGTWALYEVLTSEPGGSWLPEALEMKMNLLRAGVADVPITLPEFDRALDDSDGPDIAAARYLNRPTVWMTGGQTQPQTALTPTFHPGASSANQRTAKTINWYIRRCAELSRGPHKQRVPELLYAACHGLAAFYDPSKPEYASARLRIVSGLLAHTIIAVKEPRIASPPHGITQPTSDDPKTQHALSAGARLDAGDPEMVPSLLAAARYAANEIDPDVQQDPLPGTVLCLLEKAETTQTAAYPLTH